MRVPSWCTDPFQLIESLRFCSSLESIQKRSNYQVVQRVHLCMCVSSGLNQTLIDRKEAQRAASAYRPILQ